jgi:hypothetical protein
MNFDDSQLEEQNQQLREQNLKCTEQLDLLRNHLSQLGRHGRGSSKDRHVSAPLLLIQSQSKIIYFLADFEGESGGGGPITAAGLPAARPASASSLCIFLLSGTVFDARLVARTPPLGQSRLLLARAHVPRP